MADDVNAQTPLAPPANLESLIAHFGVKTEQLPYSLSIDIPPVPSIRDLPRGYCWGLLPLFMSVFCLFPAIIERKSEMCFPAGMYAMFAGFVAAAIVMRMERHIVLVITGNDFRVMRIFRHSARELLHLPRKAILEVRLNRSNGKLSLRIGNGEDPIELYLTPSRAVNEWITASVVDAIHHSFSTMREIGANNTMLHYEPIAKIKDHRRPLILTGLVIALVGSPLLFTPVCSLYLYVCMLAAVPLGIAMGTQKKDFYF